MSTITQTNNQRGFEFPLNDYKKQFIEYAKTVDTPVVDVGAAFGVVSIPLLNEGCSVIAVDMTESHLDQLRESVSAEAQERLTTVTGEFPTGVQLPDGCTKAILCSLILHFLGAEDLVAAIETMYNWLAPGGRVFTLSYTPYHFFLKKGIQRYEQNLKDGDEWPGLIEDCTDYVEEQGKLPKLVHLVDPDVLKREFLKADFIVDEAHYEAYTDTSKPDYISLDGREQVIVTATKPL